MLSVAAKLSRRFCDAVQYQIKRRLKPNTLAPLGAAADLVRSKADLIAENALLRQQLIILHRHSKCPQLNNFDRIKLRVLARATPLWKTALLIVQPDTLLHWHRELFRLIWRRKSRPPSRPPRIVAETIGLIRQISAANLTWGAERIRGEFLKLGIQVSKRTVHEAYDTSR
jgi:putative transposase